LYLFICFKVKRNISVNERGKETPAYIIYTDR